MHDHESVTAWFFHALGVVFLFLQAHGFGLLGVLSVCFGIWLQWRRDQREERESDARIAAMRAAR